MSGSCSYNCLNFWSCRLTYIVSELKSICICFQPEKYRWNMQYNDFLVHLSMFSWIFSKLKVFRRCPKIFSRDFERSSKVKDLFEDLYNVFQRYCKKNFFCYWNEQAKDLQEFFQNLYEVLWKFRLFKDLRASKIFIKIF